MFWAFAKATATTLLTVGPLVGCGDAKTSGSGSERTALAHQAMMTKEEVEECPEAAKDSGAVTPDAGNDAGDSGSAPAASDCGANDTTTCTVTSAFLFRTFTGRTALQDAINAGTDGDFLQVRGHCGAATLTGRTGVTIQGPFPTTGCGFNGPGPNDLSAEVDGLTVTGSTAVSVLFLNLVNSTDGLSFVNSTAAVGTCNCAAHNSADGVQVLGTNGAFVTQTLSELNNDGIQIDRSANFAITSNRATANSGTGILVTNSSFISVIANQVTNNGQFGINFTGSTNGFAAGNTLTGNANQTDNLINCSLSSVFGDNVPAGGCGLSTLVPIPIIPVAF
jgi:parallel beta-helix repeat protein